MTAYADALEWQLREMEEWDRPSGLALAQSFVRQRLLSFGSSPSAADFRRLMRHELEVAETVFLSAEVAGVVLGASAAMPSGELDPESVPFHGGWVWLESPLRFRWVDGEREHVLGRVAAVSWETEAFVAPAPPRDVDPTGISFSVYLSSPDPRLPPIFVWNESWPFGRRWEDTDAGRWLLEDGAPPADDVGDRIRAVRRFVLALFAFMRQEILIPRRERLDRAARRRIERGGWSVDPIVRVVELRRRIAVARQAAAGDAVGWACRWLVRGHWRRQFYPSSGVNRPRWIGPYVKGPKDKPLKQPRATVFAVVR